VIELLEHPVKVVVFYDRTQPLYGAVTELLQQYQLRSRMIQVEHVDYAGFRIQADVPPRQSAISLSPSRPDRRYG
jgi:hypothetical protein